MKIAYQSDAPSVRLYQGDCIETLKQLPENSCHCCVTSPPYFALRSYLPAGHDLKDKEIGSEPTPDCGFHEFGKVELRDDLTEEERSYVLQELLRLGVVR